jgi:hypothetical protein
MPAMRIGGIKGVVAECPVLEGGILTTVWPESRRKGDRLVKLTAVELTIEGLLVRMTGEAISGDPESGASVKSDCP